MNGDGFDDLIVGADRDDDNGSNSGSARVFSGLDGSVLHTFLGDAAGDYFGRSVSGAGDVNGDGFADLIVGAPDDDDNGSNSGSARVFSGVDGSVLHTFLGDAAGDYFGRSVSGAGDVNGDGFADLIVGADDDDNGADSGSARVFSGADGSVLHTFLGDATLDLFGRSVSGAGDVNGDGFADLIVGASGDDDNGSESGSARVFSGVDGSVLHTFLGDAAGDSFGSSVSGAGDVNGDGFDDLIVGAFGDDDNGSNSGSARVFSGVDGSVLHTFLGDAANDRFGRSVSGAGDVNGDGFDDLIVGADRDDDNGSNSGSARVFSGVDGRVLHTFLGDAANDRFGFSVSGAGDVNGDGFADLIVGAFLDDNNGSDSGSARVFLSTPTGFQPMPGPVQPFETVGIGGRDDDTLSGVIVSIQGPRSASGTDSIISPSTLPAGVFTPGFDQVNGQLAFFGLATVEVYEQLLRDLLVAPSVFGGGRSLIVEVIDAGGIQSDPAESGVGSVVIQSDNFDLGDAPDTFATLVASDGPRHQLSDLFLGNGIDVDIVPISNADATGDDIAGGSDERRRRHHVHQSPSLAGRGGS